MKSTSIEAARPPWRGPVCEKCGGEAFGTAVSVVCCSCGHAAYTPDGVKFLESEWGQRWLATTDGERWSKAAGYQAAKRPAQQPEKKSKHTCIHCQSEGVRYLFYDQIPPCRLYCPKCGRFSWEEADGTVKPKAPEEET